MKEGMDHSKAQVIVDEVVGKFFGVFERYNMPIVAGETNGDGNIITEERVNTIRTQIEGVVWEHLKEHHPELREEQ